MRKFPLPILLLLTLVWGVAACHRPDTNAIRLTGTVERISRPAGEFYTPAKGRQPATKVTIRLDREIAMSDYLDVLFLGMYAESDYGRVGDFVSLTIPAATPVGQPVLFTEEIRYEAISRQR